MNRSDKKMRESFGILQFFIKEGELSLRLILGGCQRMRPRGRRDDKVAGPLRCPGYVASAQKIILKIKVLLFGVDTTNEAQGA